MRTIPWMLAAVCVLTATPQAQDKARGEPAQPAPAHNTMVLTGCLAAGPDATTFKLTNAVPNAQAEAAQPRAVGTSGERVEYELKAEARLDAARVSPVDLKTFVGREVEITARAAEAVTALVPAKTSGEAKVDPDPRKPVERKAEKLTVTAVRQLSGTCR